MASAGPGHDHIPLTWARRACCTVAVRSIYGVHWCHYAARDVVRDERFGPDDESSTSDRGRDGVTHGDAGR